MGTLVTFSHCLSKLFSGKKHQPIGWLVLLTLSFTTLGSAQAETAATAPPQLKNLLAQIDAAASKHDVQAVMQFYGANFTNSDGLTPQVMAKALTQLWQRYPQLKYQTQLQSWSSQGNAISAETITSITGMQSVASDNVSLNSVIKSRQRVENQKIVQQEILSERSQLSAGAKPPTVELKLPEQVKVGQKYNFDAIVQEPLGDDYLLGGVVEEPVQASKYLNPTPVELELLPAGGIFKQGQASANAESRWISAILIRGGGMIQITQRLRVVGANTTNLTNLKSSRVSAGF